MSDKTIVISINAAWNIANFRLGLVRRLREAGYEVVALAPPDRHVARLEAAGVRFVPLPMDNKGVSPLRDAALLIRYWRALRRLRPAAMLTYTIKPNIYGSIAAALAGVPVVNNVSGLGTAFIRTTLLTRIVSTLYRIAFRRSSTVFFQNEEDRQLFVDKGLVGSARARLVPGSGIDLDLFHPGGEGRPPGAPFTFLLIARLLRDKGVVEYAEAARRLRARYPQARFQLLGFLDAANRTAIARDEVEGWVRDGIVDYLGDSDDVRPFIAAADCVVLPSYREGLPRTLLEAAAMGKPLIATDVPGCRQVVGHEREGLLCAARDTDALAAAMARMLDTSESQRAAWGAAGRLRMEREFDERLVVTRYLDAIEAALAPAG
jgi:glycosyltransferase involved in cell wall biosynthesis